MLDDRVREAEVERAVLERQLAAVGAHRVTSGNAAAKRSSSVWPTAVIRSGHGYSASKKLSLESAAERRVGDADVDHGRLRPGVVEVEEEAKLALAAPEGDARRGAAQHRRSVTASCVSDVRGFVASAALSGLEELDRIAGRVFEEDLLPAGAAHHVVPERDAFAA